MTTATDTTTDTKPATVQIVSVPPTKIADTEHVVSWERRSTEKNPVAQDQRYRGVVIPAAALKVPDDACKSKFAMLLQSTIHRLADASFTAWVKDKMQETQMPAALLTVDAVLAYWAEEKQRQSVDGDKILAWLPTSELWKVLNEKQQITWKTLLPKVAAPSYKQIIKQDEAAVIITRIPEADHQHPVAVFILQRCNNVLSDERTSAANAL